MYMNVIGGYTWPWRRAALKWLTFRVLFFPDYRSHLFTLKIKSEKGVRLTIEHDLLLKSIYQKNVLKPGNGGATYNRVRPIIGEIR